MNLTKLYEMQKLLDQRIVEQHGLEGQDLLPQKILALQVELGECANEWRGFKFWSKDRKPRNKSAVSTLKENADYFLCGICSGEFEPKEASEIDYICDHDLNMLVGMKNSNPLLEEFVDCLHFILSIGLSTGYKPATCETSVTMSDSTTQFRRLNQDLTYFDFHRTSDSYLDLLQSFKGLGELFGFTWEQIEEAYFDKNKINHTRQDTGY